MQLICSAMDARSQFSKLAVESRELRKYYYEALIHTDHLSAINLPYTESGLRFLARKGLGEKSAVARDPMYDVFCNDTERLDGSELKEIKVFCG